MPESSFLLMHTQRPRLEVDFHGPHITHHLPQELKRRRLT